MTYLMSYHMSHISYVTYDIRYVIASLIQYSTATLMTCSTASLCDVWCVECGVWCVVCNLWCVVCECCEGHSAVLYVADISTAALCHSYNTALRHSCMTQHVLYHVMYHHELQIHM